MKPWIGCEIRLLRTQLGWSRTQMARQLGCSPLKVVKMETDEVIPLSNEKVRLEALSLQLEEHVGTLHRQSIADAYMSEFGIDQVQMDEIEENENSPKNKIDIGRSID